MVKRGQKDLILHLKALNLTDDRLFQTGIKDLIVFELQIAHLVRLLAEIQQLCPGHHGLTGKLCALPGTQIKLAQLLIGVILDVARAVGRTIEYRVVNDDQLAVLGEMNVALKAVTVGLFDRGLKGNTGIFRVITGKTAMSQT